MKRLVERLMVVAEFSAATLFAFIIAVNAAQVFARYVLFSPLGWAEEVMRFAMIWIALLAGSSVLYRNEHIAITIFRDSGVAPLAKKVAAVLSIIGVITFCGVLAYTVVPVSLRNLRQIAPGSGLPFFWSYLALIVCPIFMMLGALAHLAGQFRRKIPKREEDR